MTDDDLRIMLLKQRALFGTTRALAGALGVSEQSLHRFFSGKQSIRQHKVWDALGLEAVKRTVLFVRPKEKI